MRFVWSVHSTGVRKPMTGRQASSENRANIGAKIEATRGISIDELEKFQSNLKVASGDPDTVLPKLPKATVVWGSKKVAKEVLHLLVMWSLRSYGGHTIRQQRILVERFSEIVAVLMNCFFISVRQI